MSVIRNNLLLLVLVLFVANILYVWWSPAYISMTRDEYVFYRLTMDLPAYSTDADWFVDNTAKELGYYDPMADLTNTGVVAMNEVSYTTPIWIHPPAANYLAYPIVKIFNNPVGQIKMLHLVCVAIIVLTVALFADIIRRRTNQYVAALSVFPMLVSQWLLLNGIIFYHDTFMWFFFALTMWLIERSPRSKWVVPLGVITVLTKMNAVLLLMPIGVFLWQKTKDVGIWLRVVASSLFAVASFFIVQAVVAKDIFYIFHHWGALSDVSLTFVGTVMLPRIVDYIVSWGLFIYIPLLAVGVILVLKRRAKNHYPFAIFGLVATSFGFGWAWIGYQVFPIMYASMFMVPVVFTTKSKEEQGE